MLRRPSLLPLALLFAAVALLTAVLPAAADGIVVPQPPIDRPTLPWRDIPISVKYHHVDVSIKDQVATTHVDQVFVNNANFAVEGTYIFPLPEDAAISNFDMTVDGVKLEGKLLGRDEARAIYEDIVRRQRDPALLEYVGRGAFQARIFPIPPGGERRIELSYSQVLAQQGGLLHYRYPLNTEKFSAQPVQDVSVTVSVEDGAPLRAIYSPSHPVQIKRTGDRQATASYEANNVRPDRDFDLYYSVSPDAIAVNLLSYKTSGEDGFFLLLVTPPLKAGSETIAKDVVLVMDTSGSMAGKKLQQTQAAANFVLDQLGESDRFNIISFSTAPKLFASGPQPLSRREDARAFVKALRAEGSTDINRALLEALAGAGSDRPTILIFLTDGLPTVGETSPDRILANATQAAAKTVRLFTFGVGYDVDTVLLDQLAGNLRGAGAYVKPDQAIDEEVSAFYAKVSAPVLVDVGVSFAGVKVDDLYPYPLPDLFAGSQLVVAGRYAQGGAAAVTLTGDVNGKPQSFAYSDLQLVDRGGNEFIPRLWAQRKIGYLLAQIRLNGAKDELVKEVVDLSTRYGIVTPYTSFLVEEPLQALTDAGRQQLSQSLQKGAVAPAAPAGQAPILPLFAAPAAPGGVAAPTAAPAAAAPLVSQNRSGAAAVDRSAAEKQLSSESYAGASAAPGQIRQVADKTFVQKDGAWVDTTFDASKMQAEPLAFGSARYFQLLTQHPELSPFLALGDQVTVVLDGKAYAVGAVGGTDAQPEAAATSVPSAAATPGSLATPLPAPTAGRPTPGAAATPHNTALPAASPTAALIARQPGGAPAGPQVPAPAAPAVPGLCGGAGGALALGLAGVVLSLWRRSRT